MRAKRLNPRINAAVIVDFSSSDKRTINPRRFLRSPIVNRSLRRTLPSTRWAFFFRQVLAAFFHQGGVPTAPQPPCCKQLTILSRQVRPRAV